MSFIKKIQEKPEKERKKILFTSVVIIAILLVLLWFFTMKYNLSRINFGNFQGPKINKEDFKDARDRLRNMGERIQKNVEGTKGVTDQLK